MLVSALLEQTRERLVAIPDDAPLIEAARRLRPGVDIVLVCGSDGTLAGVITKSDVVARIGECHGAGCLAATATAMTREIVACTPDDGLYDVWAKMKLGRIKNVPVVDSLSRPIGVLTARHALEALLGHAENEEALLRDYVMGVGYR